MPEKIFKLVRTRFDQMRKRILKMFTDRGILLDPSAIEALECLPDPMGCAERIIGDVGNRPLILSSPDIDRYADHVPASTHDPRAIIGKPVEDRGAARIPQGVTVVKEITGDSTCVGNVIDFAKLFNDRYRTLKKMLARRRELAGLMPIAKAKQLKRDLRFAGIVNDVRTTKNGHTIIEMEDDSDRVQVLVMKGSRNMDGSYIKDEVLGVIGATSRDGEIVIAKEIIRPDVPVNSRMLPNGSESIVAFVSDIHVGSNTFLPKEWARFIDWLNNDPVAEDIKYMIMPGDLVDGIGIYPGQEDELLIEDLYQQYRELSELVKGVPDWIKQVMMPGNHDAVRLAEPQPRLPQDIIDMFDSNILFVGNPCYLDIEGRSILAYHGKSIDDLNANIRHLNYTNPEEAMKEMLKRRHLAPIYGDKTALAPEQKDYMVIDRVPNIFVTGHVHVCKTDEYRGIKLINASAWQSQTPFQRMHNLVPDPAKVPMVHLGTGEMWVEDFSS